MPGVYGTHGARNFRSRCGCVYRKMITPMHTSMNAPNVPMFTNDSRSSRGTKPARIATMTPVAIVMRAGV